MAYLTSTTLISSVKRRASIPENQSTFTENDFLALANEEVQIGMIPLILSMQEEYYVYPSEITLVADTARYPVPYRAIGGKLRDLYYQDSSGNLIEMSRINPEDKATYQSNPDSNTYFRYFYMEGNNIVMVPGVGSSPTGTLVAAIYLRPNDLVIQDEVGIITAVNTSGANTIYTLDNIPDDFATTAEFDINQTKSGHKIRSFDLTASAINTSTKEITFTTADLTTDIVVGDHIGLAGQCFVPQIPTDLHSVLAQRIAQRCLEALGDQAGLAASTAKLTEMESRSSVLIDNRVEGAPLKIVNRKGLLRSSRLRRW